MEKLLTVLIFSSSAFVSMFIISKLLGKKQIAELDFIDYAVGITIGSIAAEMSTELEKDYWIFLLAMFVFFLLDYFVSILGIKANWMKKFFKGSPVVVIKDGELNYKALKRCKVDINDVLGLARCKGFFNISEIEYAIFETNGELSILPRSEQRPVVIGDIQKVKEVATLSINVVVDGHISKYALEHLEKDKEWIYKSLKISTKKELRNIILATYNPSTKEFTIQKK